MKPPPPLTKVTENLKLFEKFMKKVLGAKTQLQRDWFQKQLDIVQKKLTPQESQLAEIFCHRLGEALHKEIQDADAAHFSIPDYDSPVPCRPDRIPVLETAEGV